MSISGNENYFEAIFLQGTRNLFGSPINTGQILAMSPHEVLSPPMKRQVRTTHCISVLFLQWKNLILKRHELYEYKTKCPHAEIPPAYPKHPTAS